MSEIESAARELVAWFKSGNGVPVDLDFQFSRNKERIMADVQRLDRSRNNTQSPTQAIDRMMA